MSLGEQIEFSEFKENYMPHFDGYVPCQVGADEDFSEEGHICVSVEMI